MTCASCPVVPRWLLVGWVAAAGLAASAVAAAEEKPGSTPPPGFTSLFSGKDLTGWKGLVGNPKTRAAMTPEQLAAAQKKAADLVAQHWRAEGGEIVSDGRGPNLCTDKKYGDFEMWVDWKIGPKGDSGIYLRGSPQVQIWDPFNTPGAKAGSGGLYNNKKHPSNPLVVADRRPGEWNTFYIRMIGELVTVKFNGQLTVDNVPLENYWERERPIYPREQIELQTHGNETRFRNLFLREIPADEANKFLQGMGDDGFKPLFNGRDLDGWQGAVDGYAVEDGTIACKAKGGGNLLTKQEFSDFVLRLEFRTPPGGNNGVGIRVPNANVQASAAAMEIQVLDDAHEKYKDLHPWQTCGSIYGVAPAPRGYARPAGEWNFMEITAKGPQITVRLNGTCMVDADVSKIEKPADGNPHPGLKRTSGSVGFLGHNDPVAFRNIRVKELK